VVVLCSDPPGAARADARSRGEAGEHERWR
jgi:hypothetical protein